MRRAATGSVALAALALLGWATPGVAQDGRAADARENPFLSAPTEDEDRRIAERERMRQVVREMMPEFKALVQEQVAAARLQTQDDIKKAVAEVPRSEPSIQSVNVGQAQAGALAVTAKWTSYTNGLVCRDMPFGTETEPHASHTE